MERTRKIKKLEEPDKKGCNYENVWGTKRKGLKFTIENAWVRVTMNDGSIRKANGYEFGEVIENERIRIENNEG